MSDELEIRLVGTRDQVMAAYRLIGTIYDIVADQGPLPSKAPGKERFYLGVVPRAEEPASGSANERLGEDLEDDFDPAYAYCTDCGIRLDRHGECGEDTTDPRYVPPPAGWADASGRVVAPPEGPVE